MKFRLATKNDVETVAAMYYEMNEFLAGTINYPGWANDFYPVKETARTAEKEKTLFVLENDDGKIVASCILKTGLQTGYDRGQWEVDEDWQNVLSIHTLLVRLDEMKKGLSKILVKEIEKYAKENSFKVIRLDCTEMNAPAKSLYNGLGYRDAGTTSLGLEYRGLYKFYLFEKIL